MTAKEYLKQAYLLDKQIQVEVKELEQLREMRGTIQGCTYGEKIGTNPNRNLEAPFIKTIEKIWEYEQKIDAKTGGSSCSNQCGNRKYGESGGKTSS